jgi:cytochrome c oxidase subunit 1
VEFKRIHSGNGEAGEPARFFDSGSTPESSPEVHCATQWLGLALGVLMLAGLFSIVVVIGRMPPFDRLVTDPLFFKRGLVAHVNLALVAWFYSFVAAMLFLLPGRLAPSRLARHSVHISALGVAMMLLAAGMPGTQPVLSNYIPVIDHWLFGVGQILFGAGVLASFMGRRLLLLRSTRSGPFEISGAAQMGLRATAAGLVLAALTFAITAWRITPDLPVDAHYELLFWGGGHVLQLSCSVAMVSVWLILLNSALGCSPISEKAAALLFFALMAPWLTAPLLALQGTWSLGYREGFTSLMRWSIFPVVSLFLYACLRQLIQEARVGRIGISALADPRISGFLVSAALTVLGFALGAGIRGSNTMIPAHYHASIGGVTAAFMTIAYLMLQAFGFSIQTRRLRRLAAWQPVIYGVGQMIFASGFALAGIYGMSRKAYGAEQAGRGLAESIGLGVMGIGGLVAVVGGVLFLVVVAKIWRQGSENRIKTLKPVIGV